MTDVQATKHPSSNHVILFSQNMKMLIAVQHEHDSLFSHLNNCPISED